MIDNLEKYITTNNPDINWRFEDKKHILNRIQILNKEAKDLIWEKLFDNDLVRKFTLNSNKFDIYEEKQFNDDYDWTSKRLNELSNHEDKVILTWSTGQAMLTDLKTFIDNWDDFFYPSSDDLLVINKERNWIIYITHFEFFQFGQGIKIKNN